jgi:S1-C subfamily serine protease
MIEKHTGAEPFAVPQFILDAAKTVNAEEIPLDFLSDADTTGGNSGSPVVNAKGELVGLNFDRVWENVANDFGYNPAVARNVSVDINFFLWLIHDVQHADWIWKELGR